MLHKFAGLILAGSLGTLARYGLAGLVHRYDVSSFPFGTLVVNITGCFLAGFLWSLFENRWVVSGETRTIILVGFMGAFTTFSAYMLETTALMRTSEWLYAGANMFFQNGFGLFAMFAGIIVGRTI